MSITHPTQSSNGDNDPRGKHSLGLPEPGLADPGGQAGVESSGHPVDHLAEQCHVKLVVFVQSLVQEWQGAQAAHQASCKEQIQSLKPQL